VTGGLLRGDSTWRERERERDPKLARPKPQSDLDDSLHVAALISRVLIAISMLDFTSLHLDGSRIIAS